jgi:hypothetical protein
MERLRRIPHVRVAQPQGAFYVLPDVSAYYGRTAPDGTLVSPRAAMPAASFLVRALCAAPTCCVALRQVCASSSLEVWHSSYRCLFFGARLSVLHSAPARPDHSAFAAVSASDASSVAASLAAASAAAAAARVPPRPPLPPPLPD